ncbi:MAG: hypothetical protein OQL16_03670 [Gammaproteobacteria bacterium]|nr:hypothetical protein [Gammaproteobacteria bacterium]
MYNSVICSMLLKGRHVMLAAGATEKQPRSCHPLVEDKVDALLRVAIHL